MSEYVPDDRVHVVQVLEATAGGTRTHILHILEGMDPRRFRMTLIASAQRNPRFRADMVRLRPAGIRVIEVPMVRRIAPWRDAAALVRLCSVLKELDADVVHTHASKAGVLGRLAARLCGIRPVLHTPHVFYFQGKSGLRRRLFRLMERAVLPLTDRLVLLSEEQKQLAVAELGARPARAVVVANGVDAAHFSPQGRRRASRERLGIPAEAPAVGTLSRFLPQKGCDVFLRAMARVLGAVPECVCVFVGEGPLRGSMRRLAEELGMGDRMVWIAHSADPREIYEALDVFVLSSRYEGMPYTLLEAMAMGLPVVATRVPGNTAVVVDGVTGLLAAPDDPEDLEKCILELVREPDTRRRMGAEGRRRAAEQFPIEKFLQRLGSLYDETQRDRQAGG